MLSRLTISNYALIQELTVDFHAGLNSVTGETGAGKSIILGALGLIFGNRADMQVLKDKNEKCIVEGIFEIGNYNLSDFFKENDLDYDTQTILRREITPSGKSRAFINDTPVTLKLLQELALKLIDIHSQHQNLELVNQKFQLDLVDVVSGTAAVLQDYKERYAEFLRMQKSLEELIMKSEKANADLDYYQFQFDQLQEARLLPGEQEKLEAELEKLTHAEEIKTALLQVKQLFDDDQFSVVNHIREGHKIMGSIQNFVKEAPELAGRLLSVLYELKDILQETNTLTESIEHNPARIEQINDRLNLIYSLLQKHHVSSIEELITLQLGFEEKINQVVGYDEEIKTFNKEISEMKMALETRADELTAIRKKSFKTIEKSVVSDLQLLGMNKSKFEITHQPLVSFGPNGKDTISFLFSANADSAPAEISRIASGGEMSRLMLAIKNLLRKSKALPTVIFDEIDSGISGEVAVKMGNILKSFAQSTQIINITHLPQIAAKGDAHFMVYKYEHAGKTFTSVKLLTEPERIEELAKMVSGEKLTESALKTAQEMLN
ncbi:MAG: DNA repair protein RecN [Bacteroidia bacterium]|nr:DNA repair protein RecN [Bacteroidia bacterium]